MVDIISHPWSFLENTDEFIEAYIGYKNII